MVPPAWKPKPPCSHTPDSPEEPTELSYGINHLPFSLRAGLKTRQYSNNQSESVYELDSVGPRHVSRDPARISDTGLSLPISGPMQYVVSLEDLFISPDVEYFGASEPVPELAMCLAAGAVARNRRRFDG